MKSLPLAFANDLLLTAIHLEQLYTFEFPNGTYRWCTGNHSIYYGGYWWTSKQINYTNATSTMTGQADKINIEIQNVDKAFSNIVLTQDIRGKNVILYRVLLDANYQVIGSPIPFFSGYIDQMQIDRQSAKIDVYNHFVKWQTKTPKRQHGPLCSWLFGGTECAYNGIVIVNPNADIAVAFTRHGSSVANYLDVDDYMGDLCYGGTASASSSAGGQPASQAFDGSLSTYWQAGAAGGGWLQYAFPAAVIIQKYTIYPGAAGYRPTDWHFQGSNDGSNWTDLDIRSGKSWDTNETFCSFDVENTTAYTYYRLYYTLTDNVSNAIIIYELQMSGDGTQYNDSDYNSFSGTAAGADDFGIPIIQLAPDVTNIAVTVHLRAKQVTSNARNVAGRIKVFGTDYDATAITPATAFTGYDFVWLTNPLTGAAWKYNEGGPPSDDLTMANQAGTASADTVYGAGYDATKAFDNNASTVWISTATALPHWLQFLFKSGVKALGYTILGNSNASYNPTAWTLKGSNDGSNWTTLDTRSGISWSANQKQWFVIATPGTYTYYQLYITAGGVSGQIAIPEMEYFAGLFVNGCGYSTPADAGGHEVDVSECYLKNYSYANWCDLTPGRCIALNNRINFGGFYYIPELAQKEFWWGQVQKIFTGQYGT